MQSRLPELELGPRYELIDTIASGGMGTVYLGRMRGGEGAAEEGGGPRAVAIKVIHPHLAQDPEIVAMFLDEARVTTRMDHPNIIDVCDVDMVGEELVIVMAYVEGVALSRLLRALRSRTETLPIGVALRILHDTLLGLHAAHELTDEQGERMEVVHRDVSPHNLLVGTDGVTRVTDFGVATSAGRLASTRPDGGMKGKLQYLAPEQVYRRPLDRKVDIFAAGTVFWETLTGRRLFSGGTEAETLAMVLRDPIAPPSAFRADVTPAIDEVCLRALERDPARRFPNAAEFATALAQAGALASPEDVGALVMELGRETIEGHRETLKSGPRPASSVPPARVEASPRYSARLVAVAFVFLLVGGAAVHLASPASTAVAGTPASATIELVESPPPASSVLGRASDRPAVVATDFELGTETTSHAGKVRRASPVSSPQAPPIARDAGPKRRAAGSTGRPFMPDDL